MFKTKQQDIVHLPLPKFSVYGQNLITAYICRRAVMPAAAKVASLVNKLE